MTGALGLALGALLEDFDVGFYVVVGITQFCVISCWALLFVA